MQRLRVAPSVWKLWEETPEKRQKQENKFHKGKPRKTKPKFRTKSSEPITSKDGLLSVPRKKKVADKPSASRRRHARTGPRTK